MSQRVHAYAKRDGTKVRSHDRRGGPRAQTRLHSDVRRYERGEMRGVFLSLLVAVFAFIAAALTLAEALMTLVGVLFTVLSLLLVGKAERRRRVRRRQARRKRWARIMRQRRRKPARRRASREFGPRKQQPAGGSSWQRNPATGEFEQAR